MCYISNPGKDAFYDSYYVDGWLGILCAVYLPVQVTQIRQHGS